MSAIAEVLNHTDEMERARCQFDQDWRKATANSRLFAALPEKHQIAAEHFAWAVYQQAWAQQQKGTNHER